MIDRKKSFSELLLGGDLRKLRGNQKAIDAVTDQAGFDALFSLVFHHERPLVMRAADAVEKVARSHPYFLVPHKAQLLAILKSADHKELKWHIAQLLPRLALEKEEREDVWHRLLYWARNINESRIVRVNALQGLFDLAKQYEAYLPELKHTLSSLEHELIPSLQARIRKLKKHLPHES